MAFFLGPLHFYRIVYISTITSVLYIMPGTSVTPLNLTIKSQNFVYVVSWKAGNSTWAPTYYSVMYKSTGDFSTTLKSDEQKHPSNNNADFQNIKECSNITHLFCNLTKAFANPCKIYVILVKTFPENAAHYSIPTFCPYSDTCLGPPEFDISACSGCVNVTVKILSSLLEVYKKLDYKIKVKSVDFKEQDIEDSNTTERESFYKVFEGLHQNKNYCVSVDMSTSLNNMCAPSPWKCIVTNSKDQSDYVIPVICGIFVPLAVVAMIIWLQYYKAYYGDLKLKERPRVLETKHKLNYSLFDSHPEEVHTIHMIQGRGKTFGENSHNGESGNKKDAMYTNRRPLGTISKSCFKADTEDTASIGCSSTGSDCQTTEELGTEVEDSQYDVKKEDSATDQMFYPSSDMKASSVPEPEGGGCLNINLDTVKLEISNTNWDALPTLISFQEDTSDLQEPCDPDASEPKHFASIGDMQKSCIHDVSSTWQNYSGSDESESSDAEVVGEYMRR